MTSHGSFEERCIQSIREIKEAGYSNLTYHNLAPVHPLRGDTDLVFDDLAESENVRLDESFRRNFFRPADIHVAWRSTTGPLIVGEFCLNHIHQSITRSIIPPDDDSLEPGDREILGDLCVIDTAPRGGTGNLAGLYVTDDSTFDVWFYDMGLHRLERLDLGYADYLDISLITKGTSGWQYLFADVHLHSVELHTTAAGREAMLNTWRLAELVAEVDSASVPVALARALIRAGLGAPEEFDDRFFTRIDDALRHADPRVRETVLWSVSFVPYPNYRPQLAFVRDNDAVEDLRDTAGILLEGFDDSGVTEQ